MNNLTLSHELHAYNLTTADFGTSFCFVYVCFRSGQLLSPVSKSIISYVNIRNILIVGTGVS